MGLDELTDLFLIPDATSYTGTRVDPFVDGAAYFQAIQTDISATTGAGDCIYIVSYMFRPTFALDGAAGASLGDLLLNKAAAGVDVRIIIWANYHFSEDREIAAFATFLAHDDSGSTAGGNVAEAQSLRDAEVRGTDGTMTRALSQKVLIDWTGSVTGSHHQKATVIKTGGQVVAYLGGIDFEEHRRDTTAHNTWRGRSGPTGWHDAGARITGSGAAGVWNNFRNRWIEIRSCQRDRSYRIPPSISGGPYQTVHANPPMPVDLPASAPPPAPAIAPVDSPHQKVQVLASFGATRDDAGGAQAHWETMPAAGLQQISHAYHKALTAALLYVYIEDPTILDTNVSHADLFADVRHAMDAGVKVIMVTGSMLDPTDPGAPIPTHLPSSLQSVADASAHPENLSVWKVANVYVHSKLMIVDDSYLVMGSANFFARSMDGTDSELDVAVIEDAGGLDVIKLLRIALWAEHMKLLAPDGSVPGAIRSAMDSAGACLSVWRRSWGDPVTFTAPNTRLHMMGPGSWGVDP